MNPIPTGPTETMLARSGRQDARSRGRGVITYFAFKAYRRTRQRALGYLAAGFGLVTLGLVLAGMLYELLEVDLATGILLESLLVLAGFLVIAYSLYVQ